MFLFYGGTIKGRIVSLCQIVYKFFFYRFFKTKVINKSSDTINVRREVCNVKYSDKKLYNLYSGFIYIGI